MGWGHTYRMLCTFFASAALFSCIIALSATDKTLESLLLKVFHRRTRTSFLLRLRLRLLVLLFSTLALNDHVYFFLYLLIYFRFLFFDARGRGRGNDSIAGSRSGAIVSSINKKNSSCLILSS